MAARLRSPPLITEYQARVMLHHVRRDSLKRKRNANPLKQQWLQLVAAKGSEQAAIAHLEWLDRYGTEPEPDIEVATNTA